MSSNLKNHSRMLGGVFLEHGLDLGARLRATTGAFVYHYGEFGWQAWPDLTVAYALRPRVSVTGSVGWSFRIPSFTELYYRDPGNTGNTELCAGAGAVVSGGNPRGDAAFAGDGGGVSSPEP